MGSIHKGHIKLIEKCSIECDETIVSIFVNPTQFNDKTDLVNYPQSIKKDIETIKKNQSKCYNLQSKGVRFIYISCKSRGF